MLRLSRNSNITVTPRAVALVLAAALAAAAGARGDEARPAPAPSAESVARARHLMGTRLSIEVPPPGREEDIEAAFAEVARLELALSNWRDTSELTRLNREASARAVPCSEDLYDAVAAAVSWAAATGGAFDPTVEPLTRALHLRDPLDLLPAGGDPPEAAPTLLADAAAGIDERSVPVGWRHVILEESARAIRFDAQGIGLDLGGIGKGIALDAAARILRGRGVRAALLDFGGQVLALGAPPGAEGWSIGLADPVDRGRALGRIVVRDASLAVSGNGERSVVGPDGSVGHLIDPRRRRPALYTGTVTVEAPDATAADALSTALFVMGPGRGRRWAEKRGLAVAYAWRKSDAETPEIRLTSAFRARVENSRLQSAERSSGGTSP